MLSDVDRSVGAEYGARRADTEDFNEFPKRLTFLIDPAGVVRRLYDVKDVTTHPETVLADILSGAAH